MPLEKKITKEIKKGNKKMTSNEIAKMVNYQTFDDMLYKVADRHNFAWFEVVDGDLFDEVNELICAHFNVEDPSDVEYYDDWYNEMYDDL